MNHTHVLALALLFPPIFAYGITREERIKELEKRIQVVQTERVAVQCDLLSSPFSCCCYFSEEEREDLKETLLEHEEELNALYREYLTILMSE